MKLFWPAVGGIILFALLASAALYADLPARMATHWNAANQANGFMPKEWAALFMPLLMLALALLLHYLPRIDPLRRNIESFETQYHQFILILMAFLAIIHVQVPLWNIGLPISPGPVVSIGLAALFFSVGRLCAASRQNYTIGIRTPWALSDSRVWDKTNKFGGRLFMLFSPLALLGVFYPNLYLPIVLAVVLIPGLAAVIYSYMVYKKLHKGSKKSHAKKRR